MSDLVVDMPVVSADWDESVIAAVAALGLLPNEKQGEADLAALLRRTVGKPKDRELILAVLRCCCRLPAAEQYVRIEAEAQDYAQSARQRGEHDAQRRAEQIISNAERRARDIVGRTISMQRDLEEAQEEVKRRLQEMIGPHAPALALLRSIVEQYPLGYGDKMPPTAFLSACALVASLMGTNPVDLSLQFSGSSVEFGGVKK